MAAKAIVCKDCTTSFEFDEKEQDFFKKKGWSDPIRCRPCRKAKKEREKENANDS